MQHRQRCIWIVTIALTAGVGCGPGKSQEEGQKDDGGSDGISSTGGGSSAGQGATGTPTEAGSGEGGATGAGATEAGSDGDGGAGSTGAGATEGSSSGGDEPLPEACLTVDHATCFPAAVEACVGQGNWDVSQACVDAIVACYPLGTDVLVPADIIQFCTAEIDSGCLSNGGPGCGEVFCGCTAGAFPFDWDNCWHLTLVGCHAAAVSDCQAVIDGCYPGKTPEQYVVCRDQVMETVGFECDCPMCGIHEQCEVGLDACMGE